MFESHDECNERQMKYFFACIEYEEPQYLYMGVNYSYGYIDKYKVVKQSGTFNLDHYPNKNEIITNIVSHFENDECVYRNPDILCYNELTKEAYNAYY